MPFVNSTTVTTGVKPPLIVICGPTGVGKTSTTIRLGQAFGGEIINADSMQVYRRMDIGTAKPTAAEQACVPHHLVDLVDPDHQFNAAAFAARGHTIIARLHQQGKLPFLAGGTGLYIKALLYGLFDTVPRDQPLRKRLKEELDQRGSQQMHSRLAACDPLTAARLHPNDKVRILRALEVFESTGRPMVAWQQEHRFSETHYRVLKIGLTRERSQLYQRIDQRVDVMLAQGLEAEVRELLNNGYPSSLKSMQSIGYRHLCDYLEGRSSLETAVRTLKRDTRRYAKRQLTWFMADPEILWFEPEQTVSIAETIEGFIAD